MPTNFPGSVQVKQEVSDIDFRNKQNQVRMFLIHVFFPGVLSVTGGHIRGYHVDPTSAVCGLELIGSKHGGSQEQPENSP